MHSYRLKITANDYEDVQRLVLSDLPREAGAFLLAGVAKHEHATDVLVRRVIGIPSEEFTAQERFHLAISPRAINGLAALCEANAIGAVICHSHPGALPYSPTDDDGEARIFRTLRNFIPPGAPMASLLFYPGGVDGRVWCPDQERPVRLSEIAVIGRAIKRIPLSDAGANGQSDDSLTHCRQVLAFGLPGQRAIARTRVAVIGTGGTGSACAEQLVRLGVRDLVIIDYDRLDESNVSRVYGTFRKDALPRWWRKPPVKVGLIKRHLRRIDPRATVRKLVAHVAEHEAVRLLREREVIFLATDDHWGRSVANQICYQYLIPGINLGVRIDANGEVIRGAAGGVDVIRPGLACLWCKQFLSADRIAAESLPPEERAARIQERYVEDIESPNPAVVSFNTTLAGMAISTFLQLATDFMGESGAVSSIRYDIMDGTARRGATKPDPQCICHKVRGFGDFKALPTVASNAIKQLRQ